MARLLCLVLVVAALLLMSGCAGTFQPPRYKVPVVSCEYGIGPTGPASVLSLKMDGREMIRTPWFGSTPLDGRQDTAPCHTAYSLGPKGIFDIPRTLEVTWYLYTYEQLYHTVITMPAKREMQKILQQMGMETPREIRFGVYIDMPPQVKCSIGTLWMRSPSRFKLHPLATGKGVPISSAGFERQITEERFRLCAGRDLPEEYCRRRGFAYGITGAAYLEAWQELCRREGFSAASSRTRQTRCAGFGEDGGV